MQERNTTRAVAKEVDFSRACSLLQAELAELQGTRRWAPGMLGALDVDELLMSTLVGRPHGAGSLWGGADEASYLMPWLKLEVRRPISPTLLEASCSASKWLNRTLEHPGHPSNFGFLPLLEFLRDSSLGRTQA